jgi:hypothetical protein
LLVREIVDGSDDEKTDLEISEIARKCLHSRPASVSHNEFK